MDNIIAYWDFSIAGSLWRIASERDVVVMAMPVDASRALERVMKRFNSRKMIAQRTDLTVQTALQLEEFFQGTRRVFTINVELHGTDFERKVWSRLMNVGYGETTSYGELARECGVPSAARAVGGAVGRNPLLIIVPCHRVLAANGCLGGFAAGLDLKKQLLLIEGTVLYK